MIIVLNYLIYQKKVFLIAGMVDKTSDEVCNSDYVYPKKADYLQDNKVDL